jgi:hypothetical protein
MNSRLDARALQIPLSSLMVTALQLTRNSTLSDGFEYSICALRPSTILGRDKRDMVEGNAELTNREKANEAAVVAAEQFFEDRAEAKSLAQHFYGTSISHGTDNA